MGTILNKKNTQIDNFINYFESLESGLTKDWKIKSIDEKSFQVSIPNFRKFTVKKSDF